MAKPPVKPSKIEFDWTIGSPSPKAQTLTVGVVAGMHWTAALGGLINIASISPSSGTGPGTIKVTPKASMPEGSYAETLSVKTKGGTTNVPVKYVAVKAFAISVSSQNIHFNKVAGDPNPAAQTITLTVPLGAIWTIAQAGFTMGAVSPTSGTNSATLTITPDNTMTAATVGTYPETFTITSGGVTLTVNVVTTVSPAISGGLLQWPTNVSYRGAFRIPHGNFGPGTNDSYSFNYGGCALGFNPDGNSGAGSLFIVGNDQEQFIAEIDIPTSVNSGVLGNLNTATVLQNFFTILTHIPNMDDMNGRAALKIGPTIMVSGGKIYGTVWVYYDGPGNASDSHFVMSSTTLTTATITGLFRLGANGNAGKVAGWMTPIPAARQASLGGMDTMTGQGCISVVSRTNAGPGAYGITKASLSSNTTFNTFAQYPVTAFIATTHMLAGGPHGDSSSLIGPRTPSADLYNECVFLGGCFWEGDSIVFMGSNAINDTGYGLPQTFNDTNRTGKGPHSQDGLYSYEVWLFDAADYAAVVANTKNPYDVLPYQHAFFDLPFPEGFKRIGGVAFDPVARKVYASQMGAENSDNSGPFDSFPIIHVWQLV